MVVTPMSTPAIRIFDSSSHNDRYSIPRRASYAPSLSTSSIAAPMSIPNARESPPPPLPPPRFISELSAGHDPGWQWGNGVHGGEFGRSSFGSIKPGSSLLGGRPGRRESDDEDSKTDSDPDRRYSTASTIRGKADVDMSEDSLDHSDEDRRDIRRPSLASVNRLHSERQLEQRSLESSSHTYDRHLLSKIGGPNTPTRSLSSSLLSPAPHDLMHKSNSIGKLNGQLKPLAMPERRHTSVDSPATRWPSVSSGAISPGYRDFKSPILDTVNGDGSRSRYGSVSCASAYENAASKRGSYDHSVFMDNDFHMEESGMRELNINDRSPSGSEEFQLNAKTGSKRRATSPPRDQARGERSSVSDASGGHDLYHRRSIQMLTNRSSPVSRFHPNHGSVSSTTSSASGLRHGSYASSYGLSVASSATSYSSERLSPSALSPAAEFNSEPVSPYAMAKSLNPSPRGSLSRPSQQRRASEHEQAQGRQTPLEVPIRPRQSTVTRIQGMYMCECCPKKPKKFDSLEELRVHELEKQYTCAYCPNRFKNKNEAERHQNSLHLRRHSWSCAALAGVHAAFHTSTTDPFFDICGYCGEQFPNPADWEARGDHLNHVHKFGECNQAKKFFRADHFRQHLKHSHAGTSGKWTNMLENACMKDELPPKERMSSVSSGSITSSPNALLPVLSASTPPTGLQKHEVINEAHNES